MRWAGRRWQAPAEARRRAVTLGRQAGAGPAAGKGASCEDMQAGKGTARRHGRAATASPHTCWFLLCTPAHGRPSWAGPATPAALGASQPPSTLKRCCMRRHAPCATPHHAMPCHTVTHLKPVCRELAVIHRHLLPQDARLAAAWVEVDAAGQAGRQLRGNSRGGERPGSLLPSSALQCPPHPASSRPSLH